MHNNTPQGDDIHTKKLDSHVKKMEETLKDYGREVRFHVMEVYSKPRVCKMAAKMRMIPGFSLDLSVVDPDDGKPWDFNDKEKVEKRRISSGVRGRYW